MNVHSNDQKDVILIPSDLLMNQTLDMTRFLITGYMLQNSTNPLKGGIIMTIIMKRKILSEVMTTYFPSLLLMMITYATTFFKPFFFEAALSVNLTTMLVMTTIFISKMEGLPYTSDVKMIDCWLILCQLVPFAQVVLLTAIEYLRVDEKEKQKKEKQAKKKRRSEKKRKRKERNRQRDIRRGSTSAMTSTGGCLPLDLEKETDSIEKTIDQPKSTKYSLATKLMLIGKY